MHMKICIMHKNVCARKQLLVNLSKFQQISFGIFFAAICISCAVNFAMCIRGKMLENNSKTPKNKYLVQKNNQAENPTQEKQIYITGQLILQNNLLSRYIEKKTGLTCVHKLPSEISPISIAETGQKTLILRDFQGIDIDHLWNWMYVNFGSNISECFIALFNVQPGLGTEDNAIKYYVRGIFYENDPPENIAKGVQAILNGDLWFSRQILTNHILDNRYSAVLLPKTQISLTPREKQILRMIASGATNNDIGDKLFISLSTVKTHIYNIYKKINVSNRIQAVLWVSWNI